MRRTVLCTAAAVLLLSAHATRAEDGKVSGVMFADYYAVLAADDADVDAPEKQNAFRFRRIYFTWDEALSERVDLRLRFEANDAGFGSRSKMTPFVKHAYVRWKGVLGGDLYLGESGTPTWALAEKVWGYRSIEKMMLDLNGIGSSADIGVAWKGRGAGATWHLMVANGPGQRPERDNGKKLYASVQLQPGEDTHLELYGDLDLLPGGDSITAKGFLGRTGDGLRGGLEAFVRIDREASVATPGDDATRAGLSAFASLPVREGWRGFGRLDMVNDDDRDATDLVLIGGLDWDAAEGLHLMPNLLVQMPDGPDPNVQARVTGLFRF